MKVLDIKDRLKLLLRAAKIAVDPHVSALSFVWESKGGTISHTFYTKGNNPTDPIVNTFIKICSESKSVEELNKFSANWILRIAEKYAELNGIERSDVKVMATPIRIGVPVEAILEEKSTTYLSNSFIDPTNRHVVELFEIMSNEPGKKPGDALNNSMAFLREHYGELLDEKFP